MPYLPALSLLRVHLGTVVCCAYYALDIIWLIILQDLLTVPTTMPCPMVDMLSAEQLVVWVMVVQPPVRADTPARDGSHHSRGEGVEGGGASSLLPLQDTPTQQFRGIKDEDLVPQLGGVEST